VVVRVLVRVYIFNLDVSGVSASIMYMYMYTHTAIVSSNVDGDEVDYPGGVISTRQTVLSDVLSFLPETRRRVMGKTRQITCHTCPHPEPENLAHRPFVRRRD
jgi:hypothetical protein